MKLRYCHIRNGKNLFVIIYICLDFVKMLDKIIPKQIIEISFVRKLRCHLSWRRISSVQPSSRREELLSLVKWHSFTLD